MGGFPKLGVPFLGVSIIRRVIVYLGLYWGPLILGNYHIFPHSQPIPSKYKAFISAGTMINGGGRLLGKPTQGLANRGQQGPRSHAGV